MSVLPETMDSSADLQIWNNAAFDNNGEISEDLTGSRQSWGSLKSIFGNPKASFDYVSDKENRCVVPVDNNQISSTLKLSNTPFKPINADGASRTHFVSKKEFKENVDSKKSRDEKKIDEEIEEIESKILRMKSRLEALRLEKAEMSVKNAEKRGRVVPAKFMDLTQSVKNQKEKKPVEEVSSVSSRTKFQRRGISLGPEEIVLGSQRGTSIGPSGIFGAVKPKQILGKPELTTPNQSRRKSCFSKLQNITEEKAKNSSLSPKSRKVGLETQATSRRAVTTISTRKALKKDDLFIHSVQPKKLFNDGEKQLRQGRVVASRYNRNLTLASAIRKRSLPEKDYDFNQKLDVKRALSVGKTQVNGTESKNLGIESSRVKKRWEIPNEIVVHGSLEAEKSPPRSNVLLPRIKIARCTMESPRDSGPAKKVVELIGRKSYFANCEAKMVGASVCQALTYAEQGEEVEDSSFSEC